MVRGVVAKDVHVETRTLLNHRQADASGADDGDGLTGDLVAEERQERVPGRPLLFPHQALTLIHLARQHAHHEKSELGGRFGEHIGRVRERDLVLVSVGAVDVVEADRDLRHDLERALPCFEDLGVDGIAKRGDQAVDPAFYFLDDQLLRRRLGALEDLELVARSRRRFSAGSPMPEVAKIRFLLVMTSLVYTSRIASALRHALPNPQRSSHLTASSIKSPVSIVSPTPSPCFDPESVLREAAAVKSTFMRCR